MEKRQRSTFVKAVVDQMLADNAEQSKALESEQPSMRIQKPENPSRRSFLGRVGGVAAVAATAGSIVLKPLLGGKDSVADASVVGYGSGTRASDSYSYRTSTAQAENINVGVQPDNGDFAQFTDFSAQFSKSLLHDSLGLPDARSWSSMKNALMSGSPSAFQSIVMGNPGGGPNSRLNGPQGSLAFDLEGLDSHAAVIPPNPSVASAETAAEEVEHYWAALLRDVPFTQYGSSSLASQAVGDMNNLSYVNSGANNEYPAPVTTQNLFRGQVYPGDGNVMGPYVSQFMVQPTYSGVAASFATVPNVPSRGWRWQRLYDQSVGLSEHSKWRELWLAGNGSNAAVHTQWSRLCRLYSRGCAVSGILHCFSDSVASQCAPKPGQSLYRIKHSKSLRNARWTGRGGDARRNGDTSAQSGLVS